METNETIVNENIQQAVIEKLALLSLDKQRQALDFIEELTRSEPPRQTLWEMMQECIKDVPPEAFDDLPTDGALNHDYYLSFRAGRIYRFALAWRNGAGS